MAGSSCARSRARIMPIPLSALSHKGPRTLDEHTEKNRQLLYGMRTNRTHVPRKAQGDTAIDAAGWLETETHQRRSLCNRQSALPTRGASKQPSRPGPTPRPRLIQISSFSELRRPSESTKRGAKKGCGERVAMPCCERECGAGVLCVGAHLQQQHPSLAPIAYLSSRCHSPRPPDRQRRDSRRDLPT